MPQNKPARRVLRPARVLEALKPRRLRTLGLTSPLTHGPAVAAAQRRLKGDNFLKKNFFDGLGEIDGIFGPETNRACKRAKFWLGYPEKRWEVGGYGQPLEDLLSGTKPLPLAFRARRNARLLAAKRKPLRVKAFEIGLRFLGTTESPPGSNRVFASLWYGLIGAWCAMFAPSYCYALAGSKAVKRGSYWAYCPFIVAAARAGERYLSLTRNPEQGDLVLFDWAGDGVADHVGMFDVWIDRARGVFATLEGNTSAGSGGSQSDGGGVFRRQRSTSDVVCFVHVGK